ncbi:MAG: hypothetical protein R3F30_07335 [Planctomycetota bacterium]
MAAIGADYTWLAVVAGLNTVVSLFYYFRVAKALFLRGEEEALYEVPPSRVFGLAILALAFLNIWFGIFFDGAASLAQQVSAGLLPR